MRNLEIYNAVRSVPDEAQKEIQGGRLSGFTDINPMWRIKALTEQFGVCGVGWKYEIREHWLDTSMAEDEISANVLIDLYIKIDGEWSAPVQGIGGSMFVQKERGGLHTSDECYKMALTDAISVACKALGMGADIYWSNDRTKYNAPEKEEFQPEPLTEAQREFVKIKCKALEIGKTSELKKICGVGKPDEMTSAHLVKFTEYVNRKEEAIRRAQRDAAGQNV